MNNWHNGVTPINETNLNKLIENTDNFPLYRGNVPVSDLNDLTETGIYYTGNATLDHAGTNYTYCFILVIAKSGGPYTQFLIKPNNKLIMSRTFAGSPGAWSAWTTSVQEEKPTQTSLTLEDYFDTIDINKVAKTKHVVEVVFRAHTKAEIPNTTTFATLPYNSKINAVVPIYSGERYALQNPVISYTGTNANTWSSGRIPTDTWIQAHFTYITDD